MFLWYITYILHCVSTTQSQTFLHHIFDPLYPSLTLLNSFPSGNHCAVFLCLGVSVFLASLLLQFSIPHMNEIIWFLTFSVWLFSHSLVFSRPIHVVTNGHISSFHLLYYKFPSEHMWSVCSKPHPLSWWFAGNLWTSKACTCITQSLPPSSNCNRVQPRGGPQIGICNGVKNSRCPGNIRKIYRMSSPPQAWPGGKDTCSRAIESCFA